MWQTQHCCFVYYFFSCTPDIRNLRVIATILVLLTSCEKNGEPLFGFIVMKALTVIHVGFDVFTSCSGIKSFRYTSQFGARGENTGRHFCSTSG